MSDIEQRVLPYFFIILMGFVLINLLMNFCVYSFTKIRNIKWLAWYWLSLLFTFIFQGQFQYGELPIIFSYSSSVIPVVIMSMVIFDTMDKRAPVNLYLVIWTVALALTPLLSWFDFSFTVVSLPLSLAMGFVPLMTALELFRQKQSVTVLQKFMVVILCFTSLHFLNFSFFRMVPDTQLWGHGTSFALFQIYSVSVFALVLEKFSKQENEKLQKLVDIKTVELTKALSVKETLFRMVLHDIATPIQSQIWAIQLLRENRQTKTDLLQRLHDMTQLVKNVIEQVRSIEAANSGKMALDLTPVNLEKSLNDIGAIFEGRLQHKNIHLQILNLLPQGTYFMADQNVFTMSILGNLVSNSIKFSPRDSVITIRAFERDRNVILEVEDQGVGMNQELGFALFDPAKRCHRKGTLGEPGTGFGMFQVKSYLEHFGGKIDIESRPVETYPSDHGTKIRLTLNKISGHA